MSHYREPSGIGCVAKCCFNLWMLSITRSQLSMASSTSGEERVSECSPVSPKRVRRLPAGLKFEPPEEFASSAMEDATGCGAGTKSLWCGVETTKKKTKKKTKKNRKKKRKKPKRKHTQQRTQHQRRQSNKHTLVSFFDWVSTMTPPTSPAARERRPRGWWVESLTSVAANETHSQDRHPTGRNSEQRGKNR